MEKKRQLVYNALQCNKCKDVIVSRFRHDYQECSCNNISIDGGLDSGYRWVRVGIEGAVDLSVFLDDDFEKVREVFARYGQAEHKYIPLKDMSNEWIDGVINWYLSIPSGKREKQINDWALCLYIREKQYRNVDLELYENKAA